MRELELVRQLVDSTDTEKQILAAKRLKCLPVQEVAVDALFKIAMITVNKNLHEQVMITLKSIAADRIVSKFLQKARSEDPLERRRAYHNIAILEWTAPCDLIIEGLNDPYQFVQRAAAITAGYCKDPAIQPQLKIWLVNNRSAFVKEIFFRWIEWNALKLPESYYRNIRPISAILKLSSSRNRIAKIQNAVMSPKQGSQILSAFAEYHEHTRG